MSKQLASPPLESWQRALLFLASLGRVGAVVLAVGVLHWAEAFLMPVALALLLTFLLAPAVRVLQRIRLNRVAAVLIVTAFAASVLGGIGWVMASQLTGLARDLRHNPTYKQNVQEKIDALRGAGRGGVLDDIQATVDQITGGLQSNEGTRRPLLVRTEDSSLFPMMQAAVAPVLEPISSAGLVAVLVIFMLLKYDDLRNRLLGLFGEGQITLTTRALGDAGERISRYLLMQFIINSTYGLAIWLGLLWIGVPYSFLWGMLAAVLRYVPYVGPWIAAVFPILTVIAATPGWSSLIAVVILYLVCELLSNMIMEPMLYGASVGASQVALLVASGFWAWLWGPVGLVMATPLTVCLVVLGRYVPALSPFTVLLGDEPPLESPAAFYQRLLARDTSGATEIVAEHAKSNGAESVYDGVMIPALLLARQDRKVGVLPAEDEAFIFDATESIIQSWPSAKEEQPLSTDIVPGAPVVVACAARDRAEELITKMFEHLLRTSDLDVRAVPTSTLTADLVETVRLEPPAVIFIAALPGSIPQTRFLSAKLRGVLESQHILVGYWGHKDNYDKVLVRLRRAGAGYLTTSLIQTRERILSLTGDTPPPVRAVSVVAVANR